VEADLQFGYRDMLGPAQGYLRRRPRRAVVASVDWSWSGYIRPGSDEWMWAESLVDASSYEERYRGDHLFESLDPR
jgi:hypothetical protein